MRLKFDALKQNSKPDEQIAIIDVCCTKDEREKSSYHQHHRHNVYVYFAQPLVI